MKQNFIILLSLTTKLDYNIGPEQPALIFDNCSAP